MRGIQIRKHLLFITTILLICFLSSSCGKEQKTPELYLDESIPEASITVFTQNESVSDAIEECCRNILKQDSSTNLVVYSDSASFYADEGLSYRELLLKRMASGTADDLYLIPAEDVLEFDQKGYIYDLSGLECIKNLSSDALIQSTYNEKVFSIPLSYTCFGFVWNVDMLKKYDLKVPENIDEFWNVCEVLKSNGILPYGANKDFSLTVPVMCASLNEIYQSPDSDEKLKALSDGSVPISSYMERGFNFLQTMIDKEYMDPELALELLPFSEEETAFFANENCAFICAIYRGLTFENWPFEIEMTPLPLLSDGSICVVGADQRLAINPKSKNLNAAISIVESLGHTETLDSFAKNLGKISSSKNATAPDIPQSKAIIECVANGNQIPNQDFRLHFNIWNTVRDLSQKLCQGESVENICKEYDAKQAEEISLYGESR